MSARLKCKNQARVVEPSKGAKENEVCAQFQQILSLLRQLLRRLPLRQLLQCHLSLELGSEAFKVKIATLLVGANAWKGIGQLPLKPSRICWTRSARNLAPDLRLETGK